MPEAKDTHALLPASNNGANTSLPVVPEYITVHPSYAYASPEPDEESVPLSHYLWILRRHCWKILAFVLAWVVATVLISPRLTPIYESTATVDVDRQAPATVVGEDAARSAPNDAEQFLATQIRLIQSDSVLRPVVQRFHIEDEVLPADSALPAARLAEAPVTLKRLKVTRPPNTYLLLISYRSPNPTLAASVANGIADSYIQHSWDLRIQATSRLSSYMEKQLEALKAKMEQSSSALAAFEKELSVINPDQQTNILTSRLVQLNTEYTNAQADRVRKEAAYNAVKGGSLEAAQGSTQGEQLRNLADRLDLAKQQFAAVKAQYGANHPEYKKAYAQFAELQRQFDELQANVAERVNIDYQQALSREAMLKQAVDQTKAEFDRLNARSFEYKALKQEADTDKGLYDELWRKIKEAGINASFENNSIRLADSARPALKPVFPNLPLNVILAFLFSSIIGVGAAVLSDVLDTTVRDPELIQRSLKTEVLGSLPVVKSWRARVLPASANRHPSVLQPAGSPTQAAAFEEAVRTLRDSILLSDVSRRPRSLLMTSATPREGKSTISSHLAIAHSQQKRKTLLVDADLRRPSLHARFGLPNEGGLTAVVNGEIAWRDAVQNPAGFLDLDVLVGGAASRRAADRLGVVLDKLLQEAEKHYDLVILDSPPLLGFAEPLQMAAIVDGVVVVTLAGQTNRNAVASVLTSLRRLKANVIGIALNEVRSDMSDRYYYYGYYGKYYSKYYKPTQS